MKTLLLALLLGLPALHARAQAQTADATETPQADKPVILADKRIIESSGLARSIRHPGVFWTHNDSASEPCLYGINQKGATVAKVRVPKAANFDWEDITSGLDEQNRPCLYIGDIGDNLRVRLTLQIYKILEPDLPQDASKEAESAAPEIWHVAYPEGRHNAESLMMHPQTREIYLLTKKENGSSTLYKLPSTRPPGQALKLEKVMDLSFPPKERTGKRPSHACQATGADFSPDGSRLVVASPSYLYEWRLQEGEPLSVSLQQPARLILPPLTRQTEAVCYDQDSASLWITSEQLPTPLYHLQRGAR